MVLSSVFGMEDGGFTDIDQANALADTALSAVRQMVDGAFWKLLPDDQLDFGRRLEVISSILIAAAGPSADTGVPPYRCGSWLPL